MLNDLLVGRPLPEAEPVRLWRYHKPVGLVTSARDEKGRDTVRRWFGKAPGGVVDYYKLMPITYAVVIVMAGFMVLTLTADIVNPIKIF